MMRILAQGGNATTIKSLFLKIIVNILLIAPYFLFSSESYVLSISGCLFNGLTYTI